MKDTGTLNEALELVVRAQSCLEEALDKLESAGSWGIFDLLGGGLITSLIKHGKLDDAGQLVRSAQYKLESARRLLQAGEADFGLDAGEIGGCAKFFDILGDSFLADLWVQGQIAERREAVEVLLAKVNNLRRALEKLR